MDNPPKPSRTLIIACGALAREIITLTRLNNWRGLSVQCIPAKIHNTPNLIPDAVEAIIHRARPKFEQIYVAFADCGTGGKLDALLSRENLQRLPGAHCYEFYAGSAAFAKMADAAPGTFYLTDFLARHFDRLILQELGITKHPELLGMYFSNYEKLIYLAQTENPELQQLARQAAKSLQLKYEYRFTGYGELQPQLGALHESRVKWQN